MKTKHTSPALEALTRLEPFRGWTPGAVALLRPHTDLAPVAAGVVLDRVGTRARQLIGIVHGSVRAEAPCGGQVVLGPGDHYGTTELLAEDVHAFTYRTETPATLVVVFGPAFSSVAGRIPGPAGDWPADLPNRHRPVTAHRAMRRHRLVGAAT